GMELEKYHNPRLTTAIKDNKELASAVFGIIDRIVSEQGLAPYDVVLDYSPVFSESCGCQKHDSGKSNRILSEYVRQYSYVRVFEEDMTSMCNKIAANPTLDNAREHLRERSFGGSVLCITDDFYHYCTDTTGSEDITFDNSLDYPDKMHVFAQRSNCDNVQVGMEYRTKDILPDLFGSFDGNNTLVIMPIHSLDLPIGLFVTFYVESDLYFDQTYSFLMATNRCLEMVRTHERMAFLNRKLEFMFTHDQLTKIYNRYGFYKNFREDFEQHVADEKDAFIVSIDMNDMKHINDNYGHHAGDDALRIIANSLTMASENDSDIICSRFGGDEFVVAKICSGTALEESSRYREAFVAALEALNETSGNPYKVQVSIGVYCASLNSVEGVDELIDLADHLMYNDKARHKRQPRNNK
ncbi:MAG: GGDEF domain-containing protein, partial [Oscillospiraceae bacterium]|nr:GGDEF domain-containing protein [Oscillospiraceae bacterium]